MEKEEFKKRTKMFGIRAIRLVDSLPSGRTENMIGNQLMRCSTSVAANYRAACRAKSKADFLAKLGIVEEEADESIFWMELLAELGIVPADKIKNLMNEGNEILSIVVASILTTRGHMRAVKS